MKRIILWIFAILAGCAAAALAVLLFTTCLFGNHRYAPATCTEPETCERCGGTRGEPLGHEYREAICTEPETCVRCGETRGEPLGHEYREATCTEPETCERCSETRGEPLGHVMREATYQTPSVCTRCGYVDGEPVPAALLGASLRYMTVGETYPYTTASYEDFDLDVTGTACIADYRILSGDGDFPFREGYEWHVVTVRLVFSGEDAQSNGMQSAMTYGDYYTTDAEVGTQTDENGLRPFVANYRGMRVQCWQKTLPKEEEGWYGHELRFTWKEGVQVPCGYDGTLLILYHYRLARNADRLFLPAGSVLNEDALVFRMDGEGAVRED